MYAAKVVRVLIASPSDGSRERTIATEVIFEWNIAHSEHTSLVLLPIRWETHASPEMGDRPQAIINRQILENADLLVAAFWTRLGTPTGSAASGTVEEIREHVAAGRPAMLYFSNAPAHPDSVDDQQITLLREFREECMATGLCEFFGDVAEFRRKFAHHLVLTVYRHFADPNITTADAGVTHPAPVKLSEAATDLLLTAAKDPEGEVRNVRFDGGFMILANGRQFNDQSARSNALWKSALDELITHQLVEDENGGGRVFQVSQYGFGTADRLLKDVKSA